MMVKDDTEVIRKRSAATKNNVKKSEGAHQRRCPIKCFYYCSICCHFNRICINKYDEAPKS